jgi:hypothetical protein
LLDRVIIGQAEDDGRGDTLRDAFAKVNANFEDLVDLLVVRITGRDMALTGVWPGEFVPRHVSNRDPEDAPSVLGAIWLNTESGRVFISVGTGSAADWKKLVLEDRGA